MSPKHKRARKWRADRKGRTLERARFYRETKDKPGRYFMGVELRYETYDEARYHYVSYVTPRMEALRAELALAQARPTPEQIAARAKAEVNVPPDAATIAKLIANTKRQPGPSGTRYYSLDEPLPHDPETRT